jgi:hypothetical protein
VTRREDGFVALEWVAAVAMLLLPTLVLVASLPVWVERRHVATVAAREAAVAVLRDGAVPDPVRADFVARSVAATRGVDAGDVRVRVTGGEGRGAVLTIAVDVRMPALAIPGVGDVASFWYTAVHHARVADYRSKP